MSEVTLLRGGFVAPPIDSLLPECDHDELDAVTATVPAVAWEPVVMPGAPEPC